MTTGSTPKTAQAPLARSSVALSRTRQRPGHHRARVCPRGNDDSLCRYSLLTSGPCARHMCGKEH